MTETDTQAIARSGVRLHVTGWEASEPAAPRRDLLLLHGWPNAGRVWRPLAESLLLADRGLRLFAPDLRGFGGSDKPESGYRCAVFADDALDVAASLFSGANAGYVLVGHSMSGKIAQLAASRRPPGLRALVLVTPGLLAASPPVDISGRKAIYGLESKVRDMLGSWAAHPLADDVLDQLTEDALRCSRDAWNGWLSPMRDEEYGDAAAEIAVPTLVVGGGRDPQRTEEELRRGVVQRIPSAEYRRLPGSGHLPHLEEPDALAALIANFLDDLPAAGAEAPA